jgi:hypothetical protein
MDLVLCANIIFPDHHLIEYKGVLEFYLIPLSKTLSITRIQSKVDMNVIGE